VPEAVLAAAESITAQAFALDSEGAAAFLPLQGRIIALEVRGLGIRITLIPAADRIQVFGHYDCEPDCVITGAPLALLRLMRSAHKGAELGSGDVTITGDSTLAHDLTRAISGLDLDWEEQLSRLIGDPLAHRVGNTLRASADWRRQSTQTLRTDLKEYLEEEARLTPTRLELDGFLAAVDDLRDDTERLAARLERLERNAARGRDRNEPPPRKKRGGRRGKGAGQPR
jgi:ubiquinone biosynthesis accessory factor UbiJ